MKVITCLILFKIQKHVQSKKKKKQQKQTEKNFVNASH